MPENTAAVTALETAAQALNDAVAALKAAPADSRVGQRYNLNNAESRSAINALPVGSKVADRDHDIWEKDANGEWAMNGAPGDTDAFGLLVYTPVTVTEVGVQPEPDVRVGDTVRITSGFMGGPTASVVGLKGKLSKIDHVEGRTMYVIEPGFNASAVEKVEAPSAPVSTGRTSFWTERDQTEVRVERSIITHNGSAAFLKVGYNFVHLTKDEARKIADALLVHANS